MVETEDWPRAHSLNGSVTLGKIFKFSVPQLPFLWNRANNSTCHMGFWGFIMLVLTLRRVPGNSTVYISANIIIRFGAFANLLTLTVISLRESITVVTELNSVQKYTCLWITSLLEDWTQIGKLGRGISWWIFSLSQQHQLMPTCTEFCFNFLCLLDHIEFKQFKSEDLEIVFQRGIWLRKGWVKASEIKYVNCMQSTWKPCSTGTLT